MATATKCMSKMLKKELYEYCKTLIKENQKLQLFNNAQEQEINELKIKSSCTLPTIADNINRKTIDMLEKEIEELEELNTHERRNYWILSEKIHLLVDKINSLEKDLEYFQNKCEIMEKELIEEEEEAEAPTPENIDKMEKLLSERAAEYGPDFNPFNLSEEDMDED